MLMYLEQAMAEVKAERNRNAESSRGTTFMRHRIGAVEVSGEDDDGSLPYGGLGSDPVERGRWSEVMQRIAVRYRGMVPRRS